MSISVSVGANGAATGRTDQTIPGDGEIDTRPEAEAALALLPDGSTNTVKVGGREYTRAQLIEIRDRAPAAPGNGGTEAGEGVSHGLSLDGYGTGGFGNYGHNGGGGRLTYTAGIPLLRGDHRLFLDPSLGFDVGHFNKDYSTPGGEDANSAFTRYGGRLGVALRYAPPFLDHRLWASLGLGLGLSGFSTADSTMVATPGNCTPGDFGRGECEPGAGPRNGNAGTTGLINPRVGSSRGTSGLALTTDFPFTIGADIFRTDSGTGSLYAYIAPQYTQLFPSDGDGTNYWGISGGGGFIYRFGGSAVERPRRTEEVTPTRDSAPGVTRTAGEALTLADDAAVRALAGLGADARILGVQFDNLPEDTAAPYEVPASAMTAGSHELKVRYRNPGDTTDRIRVVPLTIGEPTRVPDGANGANYGAVLNMPATASRPAPDVVGGVATARPIPAGNIQTTADFPGNSTYQLYVDGNPVGTPTALPADRNTVLTLPASVTDGPHQVQLRVMRPNQTTIIYPTVAVRVGPGVATLSAGSVTSNPPSGGYYAGDPVRIRITSDVATRARVTIGSHTEDINLVAGVNDISLTGAPRTWNTGGAAGRNATNTVRVQPLDQAGALTGNGVDIGSVTTRKAGGGGHAPRRTNTLPGAGSR